MNNLFKSLVVFVFTTNIMGMHAHGGGHMKGNSADWEIETYTTAAPDFIGDFATVVSASGEVLREGTNGWTCLPFIPMPKMGYKSANEAAPACADANACLLYTSPSPRDNR